MSAHRHHVLVVEDDADVREALGFLLETAGATAILAPDGNAALELLNASDGDAPCVILLDVHMPVMDGWEFRKRQLSHPAHAAIPVVMFTADADSDRARQLGVNELLRKPNDVDAVLAAIERQCRG